MASSSATPTAKDADLYKKVPHRMEATNSRELGMKVSSWDFIKPKMYYYDYRWGASLLAGIAHLLI